MAKRTKRSILRVEGAPSALLSGGSCVLCCQPAKLFATSTNFGYLHLCHNCIVFGQRNAQRRPVQSEEESRRQKALRDAMTYAVPGSWGTGKKQ